MSRRNFAPFSATRLLTGLLLSAQSVNAQALAPGEVRGVKPSLISPSTVTVVSTVPDRGVAYSVGAVLNGNPGTWRGASSVAFLWQRCANAAAVNCTTIPGQTAAAYQLTTADVGSTLRFMVTETNSSGSTMAVANSQVVVAGSLPRPPLRNNFILLDPNGGRLTTDDLYFVVGNAVTTRAIWNDAARTPGVWQRCTLSSASCVAIPGQTADTYRFTGADVGFAIRREETATNAAGSTTAVSNLSPAIKSGVLKKPVLVGAAPTLRPERGREYMVGAALGVTQGGWDDSSSIAIRWQRCPALNDACVVISPHIARYVPTLADVGSRLRAEFTASNIAGSTVAYSNISELVRAGAGPPPQLPGGMTSFRITVVSGPGDRVGSVLRGINGPWSGSPSASTTGWLRCTGTRIDICQPIAGANSADYTVVAADANSWLKVEVSASNAAGSTTVRSDPSVQMAGLARPTDDGKPKWSDKILTIRAERGYAPGAVLMASFGSWSPAVQSVTSAWQSCDASGAACVTIAAHTQRTFTIIVDYAGRTLRYQESATNSAGTTTLTSAQTPVIVR